MATKEVSKDTLNSLTGTVIFRETEDGQIQRYKIKGYSKTGNASICLDQSNNISYIPIETLKQFKMLRSDGVFMIYAVKMDPKGKNKDVIISIGKTVEFEAGMIRPYAICRQSVNDIFYNLICKGENDQIAGLSVNRDNCPSNFDMGILMSSYDIIEKEVVYFYREDTLEDILKLVNTRTYDMILQSLYLKHAKVCGDPKAMISKEHNGWCKNLVTLLKENNFQSDINEMLGITQVVFDMKDYLVEKPLPDESKGNYITVNDELKLWLAGTFRIALNDVTVLDYDHDINLADLNNTRYFMIRDKCKKLYICVYTIKGEYLESDLQDAYEKRSFVDELRLDFIDKYRKSHKMD